MAEPLSFPRTYRPLGARMVSGVSAGVLVAMIAFLWLELPPHIRAEFGWFQRGTLLAFFVAVIAVLYAVFRTRLELLDHGVSVVNGFHRHDFAWAEVVTISLTSHRPWALMDLADGTSVSVMALQTADGDRASRAAREVAAVVADRSRTDHDD